MKISVIAAAGALLLGIGLPMYSQSGTPMMITVDPPSGLAGDVYVTQGDNLDDSHVAAVYLTDGKNDIKAAIVEQTTTSIKFKVPADVKAGRYALMVLTAGKAARYIEEPVKMTIEAAAKPIT